MIRIYELTNPTDAEDVRGYFTDSALAARVGTSLFPRSDRDAPRGLKQGARTKEKEGHVETLVVYETAEEFFIQNPEVSVALFPGELDEQAVVRARALAKLTIEECEALGLGAEQGFHKTVLEP